MATWSKRSRSRASPRSTTAASPPPPPPSSGTTPGSSPTTSSPKRSRSRTIPSKSSDGAPSWAVVPAGGPQRDRRERRERADVPGARDEDPGKRHAGHPVLHPVEAFRGGVVSEEINKTARWDPAEVSWRYRWDDSRFGEGEDRFAQCISTGIGVPIDTRFWICHVLCVGEYIGTRIKLLNHLQ